MHSAAWNSTSRSTGAAAASTTSTASVGRLWSVCGTGEGENENVLPLSPAESSLRPCPRPRRPFAFARIPAHTFTRAVSLFLPPSSPPRVLPTPIHFAHAYILARQIFAGISNDRRLPRKFSLLCGRFTQHFPRVCRPPYLTCPVGEGSFLN